MQKGFQLDTNDCWRKMIRVRMVWKVGKFEGDTYLLYNY